MKKTTLMRLVVDLNRSIQWFDWLRLLLDFGGWLVIWLARSDEWRSRAIVQVGSSSLMRGSALIKNRFCLDMKADNGLHQLPNVGQNLWLSCGYVVAN